MTQNIRYSVDGDGIAILLIDVADRPMNVLTPGFRKDLAECVDKVASDPAIRGAVIGSAKSSFMAGADIKDMAGAFERGLSASQAAKFCSCGLMERENCTLRARQKSPLKS